MLDSLRIKNFRCFEDLQIESLGRVNLIVGKNNVEKSTLLEAIFALAHNGDEHFLAQILETRNECFDSKNLLSKIKNSSTIDDIFIGDSSTYLHRKYPKDLWSEIAGNLEPGDLKPFSNVETQLESENNLAASWDKAYLHSEEDRITDALNILDNHITNVVFVQSQKTNDERVAILKIKGQAEATSLKSLGKGMSRLLNIFLKSIEAKNGFLTIDEFETGLHYSIQKKVWEKLFKLAEELNIQVFATTHSMDTMRSFCKAAVANEETEGRLISLGRDAGKTNNGKITSYIHDQAGLSWIIDSGMEIR